MTRWSVIAWKAGLASLAVSTSVALLPSAAIAQQPAVAAVAQQSAAAAVAQQRAAAAAPTTTHTAQTTNNTAACSAAGYGLGGTSYCGAAFAGWTDRSSPTGSSTQPLTQPHDPAVSGAWNISKGRGTQAGDVHSLLYPAALPR